MHWIHLTDEEQLKQILSKSQIRPQVIFKHSTRCSISSVALQRLQRVSQPSNIDFYFFETDKIINLLTETGFEIIDSIERQPYRDAEYPSKRAYIWTNIARH